MNPSTHLLRWIRIWIEKCATGSELKSSCERGFQSAIGVSLIANQKPYRIATCSDHPSPTHSRMMAVEPV